jgi:hypothetical protein
MEAPETNIRRMIQELNQYILPSTLMESFDAYREEAYKEAIRSIAPSTLAWFLDMLNRYRGPEDRHESLLEVFDPSMFTVNHFCVWVMSERADRRMFESGSDAHVREGGSICILRSLRCRKMVGR